MYMYSADGSNSAQTGRLIDYCAYYTGCRSVGGTINRAAPQVPDDSHGWYFTIGCGGADGDSCRPIGASDFGQIAIDSAAFRLGDDGQPQAESATGTLTAGGATDGSLELSAADAVSGVARAVIEVDGIAVVSARAGTERCVPVGASGTTPDYLYRQPCPARWQFDLDLPAGAIAAGRHTIRARVLDAAGNSVTAFGPRTVNVSTVKGAGASGVRLLLDGSQHLRARYGRRVTLAGRLESSAGEPLPGSPLAVTLSSSAAARSVVRQRTVTGADGRFRLTFRAGASRSIQITDPASGATLDADLQVHAPIHLHRRSGARRGLRTVQLQLPIPANSPRAARVPSGRPAVGRSDDRSQPFETGDGQGRLSRGLGISGRRPAARAAARCRRAGR
jgi:hypothetical protein